MNGTLITPGPAPSTPSNNITGDLTVSGKIKLGAGANTTLAGNAGVLANENLGFYTAAGNLIAAGVNGKVLVQERGVMYGLQQGGFLQTGWGAGAELLITVANSPYTIDNLTNPQLYILRVDTSGGAVVINLPASGAGGWDGRELFIKKTTGDANNITVNAVGGETIDGALAFVRGAAYACIHLRSRRNTFNGYDIISVF